MPDVRYFNALFGGRDIVVGLWILKAIRDGDHDLALKANIACEATDSIALAQEVRERGGLDRATGVGLAFNLVGWLELARRPPASRLIPPRAAAGAIHT